MDDDTIYRRLQRALDRMPIPFPPARSGVELRILKRLFSREDARVALCLSALPEPLPVVHRRSGHGLTEEALGNSLDSMAERGLILKYPTSEGARYGKAPFVIGIYEYQVNRLTRELERDVLQYMDEALGPALHTKRSPQMRIVPVNRTIVPERGVARYDDIRETVRASDGPFAVMNCICRQGKALVGEPCKQTHTQENCLSLGMVAKAMVARGVARLVSRDEMLAMLDRADREGLVLESQNAQNPLFVCCCCGCCCGILTTAGKLPHPAEYFHATYRAALDAAVCQECGACESRCQMGAVGSHAGATRVDNDRCIGCGLCVSTCPSGALRLERREAAKVPPPDMAALYGRIYRERFGALGVAAAAGRRALGLKV